MKIQQIVPVKVSLFIPTGRRMAQRVGVDSWALLRHLFRLEVKCIGEHGIHLVHPCVEFVRIDRLRSMSLEKHILCDLRHVFLENAQDPGYLNGGQLLEIFQFVRMRTRVCVELLGGLFKFL